MPSLTPQTPGYRRLPGETPGRRAHGSGYRDHAGIPPRCGETGARPVTDVVLAVHGTRNPAGVTVVQDLAAALADRLGLPVHAAYADVHGPTIVDVLRRMSPDRTPVLVPAFLSTGYHVHTDIPAQILLSGRTDVVATPPVGPAPALVAALADRLAEAGARPDDAVVLGAAGSRDPAARAEVVTLAQALGRRLGTAVSVEIGRAHV